MEKNNSLYLSEQSGKKNLLEEISLYQPKGDLQDECEQR